MGLPVVKTAAEGKTAAATRGAPSQGVRANLDTQRAATRAALLDAACELLSSVSLQWRAQR